MRVRTLVLVGAAALLALASAACGGGGGGSADAGGAAAGWVTVFAAASLTEAFTQIGEGFEAAHPGVRVRFNFGPSSALAAQLAQGAPADVFASADEATMTKLTDAGGHGDAPVTFATNKLEIVVGKGNPKGIASLEDLADPRLIVVVAGPQVPAGAYAARVFENAGVAVAPRSYEADVKAVVTKVAAGEADAGVVYATDARAAAARADAVAIPDELNVIASYPIAVTRAAPNTAAARLFVAYVAGAEGQATLASHGFAGAV